MPRAPSTCHESRSRGFGCERRAATHFAERLVFPYSPKQIIFRSGGNDLQTGKTPEQVCNDFKAFVAKVHSKLPETEIVFMSWNHSPSRWSSAVRERSLNELIAAYAKTQPRIKYLDVSAVSLDTNGQPRPELFVSDRLHFNADGYKLLAERVRGSLLR